MFVFIQFALIDLLVIISQVLSQNNFKPSITCYMIYESDETRIDKSDFVLSYHYYKTESTQSQTPESELCSKVGCACFSYRSTCSYSSPGTNHVSKCTDDDRQSGIIKWHRGWTSQAKCEEMRQQPQTYLDLTCCYTDRCNNQPGKIIKFVDPPVPVQPHELYGHQTPQSLPISHKPPQLYDHQTPQPLSITQKPPQPYDYQTPRTFSIAQKSSQRDDTYGHPTPQYSSISRLAYLGTVFYRSMSNASSSISQTERKIAKSIKINKPSAIIPASDKHTASLIFLHGLGDVGESWLRVFDMYKIPTIARHVKFIFPSAPIRKITINNGMSMPGWFDAYGLDRSSKEDQKGILEASKYVNDLIEEEINNGIPSERVIIGGFSQGGAVALHTALTTPHKLAGVLALSTWLPLSSTFPKALVSGEKKVNLPILQCHGNQDPVVDMRWGRLTEQLLNTMGFKQYVFKEYHGLVHSSSDEEIKDVIAFIKKHLPKI